MSSTALSRPALFSTLRGASLAHPLADIFRSADLRKLLPGIGLASLLYNFAALALPMTILQVIDRVIVNRSIETLVLLVCGVLACLILEEFLRAINTLVTGWLGARFEHAAGIAALDRLMRVARRVLNRDESGVHSERIAAAGRVAEFYSGQALLVLFDLPFVVIFLIMIYIIGGWVVLVPLVLLGFFSLAIRIFGVRMREQVEQRRIHEERRFNFLRQVFAGVHSVKTLAMEAQMERRHDLLQATNAQEAKTLSYGSAIAASTSMLFSQAMVISVACAGALTVLWGEMTPGGLAACMMLSVRALQPLRRSFSIWLRYQSFITEHGRLREIAQMPWVDDSGKPSLAPLRREIELRQVTFGRDGSGPPLLRDLNLTVRVGECVAIRGDSGSGKSTLLYLMNGMDQPDGGVVLADGKSLADFSADSVQHQIALLAQTGTIFQGTVLENLTMFNARLQDAVLEIARQVGLDQVVGQMRLGYQTPLGEGSIETLPAGVRQLISIVRALAHNPSVILFDEANISIDMESDRLLRQYLASRKGHSALILVTHRPSLLSLADRTLTMSMGAFAEAGQVPPPGGASEATREPAEPMAPKPPPVEDLAAMVRQYFPEETDLARCLMPMLQTLGWKGSARELTEALPQTVHSLDVTGYCSVMANLGFQPHQIAGRLDRLDTRLTPCLFVPAAAPALVVKGRMPDGRMLCFDAGTQGESALTADAVAGVFFLFSPLDTLAQGTAAPGRFFGSLVLRFQSHIILMLLLAACSTMIALAPPLFVMSIYDQVLPNGDLAILGYLFVGVCTLLALDFQLRKLKGRVMAFVAGRAEFIVGISIFNRILGLPASATENVSVNRQIGRMRSFDSLRDLFHGPLSMLIFDLPVSLILLVAIAAFNPPVLLVVLAGTMGFVLLGLAGRGPVERRVARSSRTIAAQREFLDETIDLMSTLRATGSRAIWLERFRQMSAKSVSAAYRARQYQARINGGAQLLGTTTGLMALAVCAYAAADGNLSTGLMIATMMIVWRLTGPMQNIFLAASSLVSIRSTLLQIENLIRLPSESAGGKRVAVRPGTQGSISFARVSFRYANEADPALLGISLNVTPGQVIVITGPNGSGKSTLLKLITRAFTPQAGTIRFDNLDIRQLTIADLRSHISYMPQNCDLFYGTIAQNLRLVHPAASQQEIEWAAKMAGLLEQVRSLPMGFDTRISNNYSEQLPNGLRQRLALARAVLKPASLVVFDEPGAGLDEAGEQALQRCFEWLRGRATLIIVSHRPAHMRLADSVLYMEHGGIVASGSFESIKGKIMGEIQK